MQVNIPWPATILFPNRNTGKHWSVKGRAAKKYKADCLWVLSGIPKWTQEGNIPLSIMFHPPSKRHFDLDGCHSAIKHGLDALADRLGVNDVRFRPVTADFGPVIKGGVVVLTIGEDK